MSRQSYNETSLQVRIDRDWHRYAKLYAAHIGKSIKEVIEQGLAEVIPPEFMSKQKR